MKRKSPWDIDLDDKQYWHKAMKAYQDYDKKAKNSLVMIPMNGEEVIQPKNWIEIFLQSFEEPLKREIENQRQFLFLAGYTARMKERKIKK